MNIKKIDIHTHGIGGYDTHADSAYGILKIAEMQGYAGVSEIILSIYPSQIELMRLEMSIIQKAIAMQNEKTELSADTSKHFSEKLPAKIIGIHLEGPFLNKKQCGSLNPDNFLEPSEYSLKKLIEGFEDVIRIITIAPELEGSTKLIKKITDMGIIASMGHSDATYDEAEEGYNCGAKGITHIFNAMRGFHHREPGIAGFAVINNYIYIEAIADPHHLHPATLQMIFKLKNPEKIIIISDSVKETRLSNFIMPVREASGKLSGGSMTITEIANRLIEKGFERDMIFKCITDNPRRYMAT